MTPRYAIYYAPAPESPLWAFGSAVLGYDAATGARRPPMAPDGFTQDEWTAITAQPRRYGFHATLKAPFRLAKGATEDDLVSAGRIFARGRKRFPLPDLTVSTIEGFVALTPVERSKELEALGAGCVEAFEGLRAPLTTEELAHRLKPALDDRQRAALKRWGYPYVFEDFRFHMTLTGPLEPEQAQLAAAGLAPLYAERAAPIATTVDAVTLYVEERPGEGFRIVDRFVFGN
jgi:putative phosphonate metabolism protein